MDLVFNKIKKQFNIFLLLFTLSLLQTVAQDSISFELFENVDSWNDIQRVNDGYVVVGRTEVAGFNDMLVAKLKKNFTPEWSYAYGGGHHDEGASLVVDDAGNIFICGRSRSIASSEYEFFVLRLNSLGQQEWLNTYRENVSAVVENGSAHEILLLDNGNIGVTGNIMHNFAELSDRVYLELSKNDGSIIQSQMINCDSTFEMGSGFYLIDENEYILSSAMIYKGELLHGVSDIQVVKVKDGAVEWAKLIGTEEEESNGTGSTLSGVYQLGDGFIMITITKAGEQLDNKNVLIARLGMDGDTVWTKVIGSPLDDDIHVKDFFRVSDDQFYVLINSRNGDELLGRVLMNTNGDILSQDFYNPGGFFFTAGYTRYNNVEVFSGLNNYTGENNAYIFSKEINGLICGHVDTNFQYEEENVHVIVEDLNCTVKELSGVTSHTFPQVAFSLGERTICQQFIGVPSILSDKFVELCPGDSAVLRSISEDFWWSESSAPIVNISNETSLSVFPVQSTTYYLNSDYGKRDSIQLIVFDTLDAQCVVSILEGDSIASCPGNEVVLNADGEHVWWAKADEPQIPLLEGQSSLSILPEETSNYYLYKHEILYDSILVYLLKEDDLPCAAPIIVEGDTLEVCEGESAALNANRDDVWWSLVTAPDDTVSETRELLIQAVASTAYYLTASNGKRDTIVVTVIPFDDLLCVAPIILEGDTMSVCEGDTTQLTANRSDVRWTHVSTPNVSMASGNTAIITPFTFGTEDTLWLYAIAGNEMRDSIVITLHSTDDVRCAAPIIQEGDSLITCKNEIVTLHADRDDVQWVNMQFPDSILSLTSELTVKVTSEHRISVTTKLLKSDEIILRTYPEDGDICEQVIINEGDSLFGCPGDQFRITANFDGIWWWYQDAPNDTIALGDELIISPNTSGWYFASNGSKRFSDSIFVAIQSPQSLACRIPAILAPDTLIICEETTIELNADTNDVIWYNSLIPDIVLSTEQQLVITPTANTFYVLMASNGRSDSIRVEVHSKGQAACAQPRILGNDTLDICPGTDKIIRAETEGFWWSTSAQGTPVIGEGSSIFVSPQTTTTYYLNAENGAQDSVLVQLYPEEAVYCRPPSITQGDTVLACINSSLILSCDRSDVRWTSAVSDDSLWGTSRELYIEQVHQSTTYYVKADNKKVDSVFVKVVPEDDPFCLEVVVYELLTPNADGDNDKFLIENIAHYKSFNVSVYNVYGQLVFKAHNYKNDWNGDELGDGTYYYFIKIEDTSEMLSGQLIIQR